MTFVTILRGKAENSLKKIEDEIVTKIKNFTQMQSAFNTKYGLVSDCMMVMPPSGIRCVDGKAVLVSGNSALESQ